MRGRNGVCAYRKGKLYYSGLASDLRGRLRWHLRDRHAQRWDTFSVYLTIGDKHLRELESPDPSCRAATRQASSANSLVLKISPDHSAVKLRISSVPKGTGYSGARL
jgi:hypothetical protein